MRRWMWWAMGVVVLLALVFALSQIPPAMPYEFLGRHNAAEIRPSREEAVLLGPEEGNFAYYLIKADPESLKKEIDRELEAKGLENDGFEDYYHGATYFEPDSARPGQWRQKVVIHDNIKIVRRRRMVSPGRSISVLRWDFDRPGWVAIQVFGVPEPSWLDNFRSWLGF